MVSRPEDYRWSSYGVAMSPNMGKKSARLREWAREGLCRVMELHRKTSGERGILPEDFSVMWDGPQAQVAPPSQTSHQSKENKLQVKKVGAGSDSQGQEITGSAWYRMMLYADGEEVFVSRPESGIENVRVRVGFKREDVKTVLKNGGKLSFGEVLRCRFRYLTDGLVFGRQRFLNDVFQKARGYFGEKRKSGARPMREIAWQQPRTERLYSMRALKKEVLE
jgi:hypothetical protein